MMRVSRAEEGLFGSSRPAFQGRIKIGFAANGRVTAVDFCVVQQNGPTRAAATTVRRPVRSRCCISRLRCATAA